MNPKGQHLFEVYTRLSCARVASYTSHTQSCLNTKQIAVKIISKVQQALGVNSLAMLMYSEFHRVKMAKRYLVPNRYVLYHNKDSMGDLIG